MSQKETFVWLSLLMKFTVAGYLIPLYENVSVLPCLPKGPVWFKRELNDQ